MRRLLLGSFVLLACTRSEPAAPVDIEPAAPAVVDTPLHLPIAMREREWISIERTACYGSCPQFTITATSTGAVEWIGRKDVHLLGPAYRVVDADAVAKLYAEYAALDWLEIPQWDQSGADDDCATDSPSTIVTLGRGHVTRTLHDYHGCKSEARSQMRVLDKRLMDLLAAPDWIEGDPELRPDPDCLVAEFRPIFTARASAPWATFTNAAVWSFSRAENDKYTLEIVAVANGDAAFVEHVDKLKSSLRRRVYGFDDIDAKILPTGPRPGEIRVVLTPPGCPRDE